MSVEVMTPSRCCSWSRTGKEFSEYSRISSRQSAIFSWSYKTGKDVMTNSVNLSDSLALIRSLKSTTPQKRPLLSTTYKVSILSLSSDCLINSRIACLTVYKMLSLMKLVVIKEPSSSSSYDWMRRISSSTLSSIFSKSFSSMVSSTCSNKSTASSVSISSTILAASLMLISLI